MLGTKNNAGNQRKCCHCSIGLSRPVAAVAQPRAASTARTAGARHTRGQQAGAGARTRAARWFTCEPRAVRVKKECVMLRCIPCVGKTSLQPKYGHGKCNGLHVPPTTTTTTTTTTHTTTTTTTTTTATTTTTVSPTRKAIRVTRAWREMTGDLPWTPLGHPLDTPWTPLGSSSDLISKLMNLSTSCLHRLCTADFHCIPSQVKLCWTAWEPARRTQEGHIAEFRVRCAVRVVRVHASLVSLSCAAPVCPASARPGPARTAPAHLVTTTASILCHRSDTRGRTLKHL